MAKIEIKINGEAYPCRPTMGAMLRFKEQTGKEITELDTNSFTDLCTYLWCCIKSACAREQKQFDLSLIEFADRTLPGRQLRYYQPGTYRPRTGRQYVQYSAGK